MTYISDIRKENFYFSKTIKSSRKAHVCHYCGKTIKPHSIYFRTSCKLKDEFITATECINCHSNHSCNSLYSSSIINDPCYSYYDIEWGIDFPNLKEEYEYNTNY